MRSNKTSARRYLVCPECGKRSAYLRLGADDAWLCRTRECEWYAYSGGHDRADVEAREALKAANPDQAHRI